MNRLHIALFDRSRDWLVMKEDIYTSLYYWLACLGGKVTMEYGRLEPKALNIIVGLQYLSPEDIAAIAASTLDYGLFDIEILKNGMVNFKPETRWLFAEQGQKFFGRCRFALSYFQESVDTLKSIGVFALKFVPGYCPLLEAPMPSPIPEAEKSVDVLFFGNVDTHRAPILERIAQHASLEVDAPQQVTPMYLRNLQAARSRIILSLGRARPFTHIGPMRLVSMAHLKAFCLSEPASRPQPELAGLCTFWEPGQDPLEAVRFWLDTPERRHERAAAAYARLRELNPQAILAAALGQK